jgi:H+/Cl- antiporter ClcA
MGALTRLRVRGRRRPAQRPEFLTISLAALTTLSLGAVLGPEAPLIAIGGGLAALTVRLVKKDAPRWL